MTAADEALARLAEAVRAALDQVHGPAKVALLQALAEADAPRMADLHGAVETRPRTLQAVSVRAWSVIGPDGGLRPGGAASTRDAAAAWIGAARGARPGLMARGWATVPVLITTRDHDEERRELQDRTRKAMAESPDNPFLEGWRAACGDVLKVLDSQDACPRLVSDKAMPPSPTAAPTRVPHP